MREYAERAVRRGGVPSMPDTPERSRLERQRNVRQFIFGMQDGVLTTLGIVTGVGAAAPERMARTAATRRARAATEPRFESMW